MSESDVIRAWKDEEYRAGLSEAQLAMLPQNPAGLVELTNPLLVDGAAFLERSDLWLTECSCLTCITLCAPTFESCLTFCPVEDGTQNLMIN